jgi:thiamine-phosphate pyrophosphorylase
MAEDAPQQPQLYLITPPAFDLDVFPVLLSRVLDAAPIACLRLAMATSDEDMLTRAADALREIAHARDIPLVIERHALLAQRLGLDGVHLPRGAGAGLRKLRKELGPDAIIGASAGTSRHDGLTLAEAGADYVAFAPMGETALDDGARVDPDLIEWWSEVIEVPVVVEGALTLDLVASLAPLADFLAFGEEIWRSDEPAAALRSLIAPLNL